MREAFRLDGSGRPDRPEADEVAVPSAKLENWHEHTQVDGYRGPTDRVLSDVVSVAVTYAGTGRHAPFRSSIAAERLGVRRSPRNCRSSRVSSRLVLSVSA